MCCVTNFLCDDIGANDDPSTSYNANAHHTGAMMDSAHLPAITCPAELATSTDSSGSSMDVLGSEPCTPPGNGHHPLTFENMNQFQVGPAASLSHVCSLLHLGEH